MVEWKESRRPYTRKVEIRFSGNLGIGHLDWLWLLEIAQPAATRRLPSCL